MSGLDPTGASQPALKDAYETAGNPAQQEPAEKTAAQKNASKDRGEVVDQRIPTEQSHGTEDATPSSLGHGIHGAPRGEEAQGSTAEDVGRHNELEGEQMRAPGEGEVASAVKAKPGAGGAQQDLASDLDRKKAEQQPERDAIKEQRQSAVDVGGILANRGGPANPVGKDNYPNSDTQ